MAKKITGQDLFDVQSFDQATQQIATLIGDITKAIDGAKNSSIQLSTILASQLKQEISALSAQSKTLSKEMEDMEKKFNSFKSGVATANTTINRYEKANKELEAQLKKVKQELSNLSKAQATTNKSQSEGAVSASKLSQSLLGVASGAALLYKGITLVKEQLSLAVKSTIEFEKAMKEVQAISRATGDELLQLTENANRLGATTEKTATQIANLQKELGKLGFNTTEILASTDAIVDLSTATGEDLAGSATVAAATLRAFGLEAIEMTRVVDVMAGSFVRSGLDLEKFRESMKLVAPIARATNINIETTTAALSKLADAGLSGSLAGTALRNLFSNMADPTSKLATFLGYTVTNSEDLIKAFRDLRERGVGLAEAVQMIDVRARPAFFTLLNQVDAVEKLSIQYKILDGEANSIAETMRDSLANDIDIANSAFDALRRNIVEQFMPQLREGVQATTSFSEAMRFLVNDLADFTNGLEKNEGILSKWVNLSTFIPRKLSVATKYITEQYVAYGRHDEAVQGTTLSLGRATDQLKNMREELELLEGVSSLSDSIKKGILDESNWKLILNYQEVLGEEFNSIFRAIDNGQISFKEGATAIQGQLEGNLKTIKSTYEQEQVNLELLEKQLKAKRELQTEEVLRGGLNNPINIEIRALEQQIELTYEFLKANKEAYGTLSKLFKDSESASGDYNKELGTTKKKLGDIILLELERQKIIAQGREQELAFQLKEVDEGILTAFKKKEILKDLTQERIRLAEIALEKELRNIELAEDGTRQTLIKQQTAYEKYYNEISKIRRDSFKEAKNINNAEEQHFKDMVKANIDAFKRSQKNWKDVLKEKESSMEETISNIADMVAKSMQYVSRLTTEIFNNQQIRRENELRAIDNWEQRRIELAGDNAEAIEAIEKEAERKRNEVRIRQAKADRREALFQIAIQTAQGIMRAVAQSPLTGGLPFSAIVAALGAAQATVVASRPLPEFYKGTDNSPEGLAVVGDRYGRELIQDGKTGEYRLTPNKATVQYLSEGSKVFTNKETERILSSVDHNGIAVGKLASTEQVPRTPAIDYDKLGKTFEGAVTKIPVSTTNFDERGVRTFITKGRSKVERLNNRYRY